MSSHGGQNTAGIEESIKAFHRCKTLMAEGSLSTGAPREFTSFEPYPHHLITQTQTAEDRVSV